MGPEHVGKDDKRKYL